MTQPKIAHVISFDFDGCLLPSQDVNAYPNISRDNLQFLLALKRQAEIAYAATFVFIFSNRQAWQTNENNRIHPHLNPNADPTSCFLAIKNIAEQGLDSTFCSLLMSDIYSQRPDGYSHTRAVAKAHDRTTYHPEWLFDENKATILYTQVHTAAKNMRECDFFIYPFAPKDNAFAFNDFCKSPFKSNAAYIYCKNEQLFYVNKIEKQCIELKIKKPDILEEMLEELSARIANEEHDFEMFDHDEEIDTTISGITLSSKNDLDNMQVMTGHRHIKKDYPIVFDSYDDTTAILDVLHDTFDGKNERSYLPKNVVIRLNYYSSNDKDPSLGKIAHEISGSGGIDLNPKETIFKLGQLFLAKSKYEENDFINSYDFSDYFQSSATKTFFQLRNTHQPSISHPSPKYAPIDDYCCILLTPEEVKAARKFIEKKEKPPYFNFFSVYFNKHHTLSSNLSLLLNCLDKHNAIILARSIVNDLHYATAGLPTAIDQRLRNEIAAMDKELTLAL